MHELLRNAAHIHASATQALAYKKDTKTTPRSRVPKNIRNLKIQALSSSFSSFSNSMFSRSCLISNTNMSLAQVVPAGDGFTKSATATYQVGTCVRSLASSHFHHFIFHFFSFISNFYLMFISFSPMNFITDWLAHTRPLRHTKPLPRGQQLAWPLPTHQSRHR